MSDDGASEARTPVQSYELLLLRPDRRHRPCVRASDPDTERIITDDWPAYKGIGDHNTRHDVVRHKDKQYVVGDVHTNTIESVWSLLNRSIIGAYHKLSVEHLDAYLDELEWRFNNRKNPYLFRETLRKLLSATALPYARLTQVSNDAV